jgi:hypothetical protein
MRTRASILAMAQRVDDWNFDFPPSPARVSEAQLI